MSSDDSDRRQDILDAALECFTAYGFSLTSMGDIAEGASISRQGLYLHFENKEAIYRAVLEDILDRACTAAIDALNQEPTIALQLEGFLQRSWGDLSTWTLNTRHGADMIQAKTRYAADVVQANTKRARLALVAYLQATAPKASRSQVMGWIDLLTMAPVGFRYDEPAISRYRTRLSQLAAATEADIARMV